ncbi:hypothetical protein CTAYLR_003550 [Chrysophaeum taylorii]|uniref:Deacetylase sirtuin-type domain-containing protein n=1 Tax=Chrysophaeum taylorii TaxID=2483200 RepID=A0AAD7UML1_9STRA|nr:hypothetical protein CTAYLR_003550 [Chrysophaeum taylorii]
MLAVESRGLDRVVAFCGAGLSAESGIPTYRDAIGVWSSSLGLLVFGTKLGWLFLPELSYRVYSNRLREPIERASPDAGHRALADLEALVGAVPVITQNIDGLSQRAGSTEVLEIHGSALTERHARTGAPNPTTFRRPDVVLFGESMPGAFFDALDLVHSLDDRDVLIVVGTSCSVAPAATLPYVAMKRGARVIELNLRRELASEYQETIPSFADDAALPVGPPIPVAHLQTFIPGRAATTLPQLYAATLEARRQDVLFNKTTKHRSLIWGKTSCW